MFISVGDRRCLWAWSSYSYSEGIGKWICNIFHIVIYSYICTFKTSDLRRCLRSMRSVDSLEWEGECIILWCEYTKSKHVKAIFVLLFWMLCWLHWLFVTWDLENDFIAAICGMFDPWPCIFRNLRQNIVHTIMIKAWKLVHSKNITQIKVLGIGPLQFWPLTLVIAVFFFNYR